MKKINKFYGKYQHLRDAAWQFLLDFEIGELPLDADSICRRMGLELVTYSKGKDLILALGLGESCAQNYAFTVCFRRSWIVFVRDGLSLEDYTHSVLHEVAHILLGHKMSPRDTIFNKIVYTTENRNRPGKDPIEREADMFADRIMAPAGVLRLLSCNSSFDCCNAEDIMRLCRMPLPYAALRARRMRELTHRNCFFTKKLESEMTSGFLKFIVGRQQSPGTPDAASENYSL